ncbi:hypothetical protein AYI69_g5046 [Smittium culicis]|uniref:Uncharacterized protein n=1 Tax=Smittium culicis TaxID=133412 RepID=A0A1R1XUK1_9FUNG|nr:hypothetical protein AYI69_g7117 [Smittium culicis]OMJ23258.1 hypothetical protein AYI69_g5046 [Smittium culicis]
MVSLFRIIGGALGIMIFSSIYNNILIKEVSAIIIEYPKYSGLVQGVRDSLQPLASELATDNMIGLVLSAYRKSFKSAFSSLVVSSALAFVVSLGIKHYPLDKSEEKLPK